MWGHKFKEKDILDDLKETHCKAGIKTGFKPLDDWDFTLYGQELTGILGYSGEGKTTITINMLLFLAKNNPSLKIGYYSLEIPEVQVEIKIASIVKDIPIKTIYENKIEQWKTNEKCWNYWKDAFNNIHFEFETQNIDKILQSITDNDLDVIFIDNFSLITTYEKGMEYQIQSQIINKLRLFANNTKKAIIILFQPRKQVSGEMPTLNRFDIKGASDLVNALANTFVIIKKDKETIRKEQAKAKQFKLSDDLLNNSDLDFIGLRWDKYRRYPPNIKNKLLIFDKRTCQLVEYKNNKITYQHEIGEENDINKKPTNTWDNF